MDLSTLNDELPVISINTDRIATALEGLCEQMRIQNRLLAAVAAVANESSAFGGYTDEGLTDHIERALKL